MSSLTITIVTVCLNDYEGVIKTHNSLNSQADKNFEWIVIDANSQDSTCDFLERCSRRPDILKSEADFGIYDGMNKGGNLASGKYTLYLNSGDVLYSITTIGDLKTAFAELHDSDPSCCIFSFSYRGVVRQPRPLWWRYWSLPSSHQSMLYQSDFFKKNQYDHSYQLAGDYEHFLRIFSKGRVISLPHLVVGSNEVYGASSSFDTMEVEYTRALSMHVRWPFARLLMIIRFKYLKFLSVF